MSYIGRQPQIGNFQICDAISTVNNQAAYTMQVGSVNVLPETANHMIVSLNGVIQAPISSFTVSGSTITFAANLVTGDVINFIQILGDVLDLGVPSDGTVTSGKLGADSVNATKIADGSIENEHLNVLAITGQTAQTSIADGDTILIHDASASALRKMTKANFVAGIGGANTPQFSARASSNQTIANSTLTKVVFGTEVFDPQGTFASSRFTPAVAGNYFMTTSIRFANGGTYIPTIQVRLNGTNIYWVGGTKAASAQYMNVSFSFAITMDDNDYVEIFAQQDSGGNLDIHGGSDVGTVFNGFKLI